MRRVLPALLFPLLLCASLRLGGAVWVRTANYTYDSAGNRIQQIYQATLPEPGNTTNAPYITTNTTYSYIQVGRDNFLTVANLTTGWWKSGSNKLQQVAEYSAFSYDDQGRRQFEDRYDYYDYDTDGGHTGYGTIGGNYSGTYYSYNEPVTVKLHDGVSPVRAYTLTASSTGNTGNLSVPAEDWLRGSDWGGGIGGILYSQVEFGNATTASYYHYDGRGDVVALTSNTGNVTYAAAYNAYGTHAVSLNATTNVTITGTQEVGTDLDPFRTNTREEWDSADGTAFVKEGHRIRGLETDTYNSRDPLGQAAGTNYYTYVLQDEWTKTDPLGLQDPAPSPRATLQLLPLIAVGLIGSAIVWQDITHGFHPSSTPSSDQSPAPTITTTQPPPTATPPGGQVPKPTTATPGSTAPAIPNTTGGTPAAPLPNATPGSSPTPLPITTPGQQVSPSGSAIQPDIMNSEIQGQATPSPQITPSDLKGKTPEEIRQLAGDLGLVPHPTKPDKWIDPVTGKERLRLDPGHKDKDTGLPYDDPKAAVPHSHGYEPDGKTKVVDPEDGNPHFPTN